MKNNSGITMITLVITIIVIILIASITIYSGLDTMESIRIKEANDTTNAIYLALIANEDIIPYASGDDKTIADYETITDRTLTNEDYKLLGLDYSTDNCTVIFDKSLSGENLLVYNFTYINNLKEKYDNHYSIYVEVPNTNINVDFDNVNGVNRPIIIDSEMTPLGYDGNEIINTYAEKWYNYEKNASRLATATYKGQTFVWIPRFAYKIQSFYLGKSYRGVPDTAIDIVFLRENTDYMSNNEVLQVGYNVHPAFASGEVGFWVSTESINATNSIAFAIDGAESFADGYSYLMRNSEYAAAVYLSKYLNNNQIVFSDKEFVAAVCDDTIQNFDIYSTSYLAINNIAGIQGHALMDTPWELSIESVLPDASYKYIIRDPATSGVFYYKASGGVEDAVYRVVLKNNF